ncbi:MAG: hypothetical protein MJA84_12995, partial [Firmicutes bacterium]|nr:hypothetical protein [Bacillota bacterium]
KKKKTVQSGKTHDFGSYELKPGKRIVNIRWKDPDTGEWNEAKKIEEVRAGLSSSVTFATARSNVSLSVETASDTVEILKGEREDVRLYFRNTGNVTARDIKVFPACNSDFIKVEDEFGVVDIKSGGMTFADVQLIGQREGEWELKVQIKGGNFDAVIIAVKVNVKSSLYRNIPDRGRIAKAGKDGDIEVETYEVDDEKRKEIRKADSLRNNVTKEFSSVVENKGIDIKFDMYGIFLYKVYNAFIANAALDGRQLKLDEARQSPIRRHEAPGYTDLSTNRKVI